MLVSLTSQAVAALDVLVAAVVAAGVLVALTSLAPFVPLQHGQNKRDWHFARAGYFFNSATNVIRRIWELSSEEGTKAPLVFEEVADATTFTKTLCVCLSR